MTEQTKVFLRIGGVVALFVLSVVAIFLYKAIWAKAIWTIIACVLGYMLYRTYLSYKRKKFYIEGKVLSVVRPTNKLKIGKTKVIIKAGKVSKKLYAWQPLTMKVGEMYAVYYEDKSNSILKYQALKGSMMMRPNRSNIPPQYR